MSFFTTSVTDAELSTLQLQIGQILINHQKKLNKIEGRKVNIQVYENLKKQIFAQCANEIERRLIEFQIAKTPEQALNLLKEKIKGGDDL